MSADWSALRLRLGTAQSLRIPWDELDSLVGGLPASAHDHQAFWSGDRPAWRGFRTTNVRVGHEVTFVRIGAEAPPIASETGVLAGGSHEQRTAEPIMLALLGEALGVELAPRRLTDLDGVRVEIDGASPDLSILVECWAHQGTAKVAQKNKLANDALKLQWVASWLYPKPERLIICVSDEDAVRHLRGKSWQGKAIAAAGVELHVVTLPPEVVESIYAAQQRQYR